MCVFRGILSLKESLWNVGLKIFPYLCKCGGQARPCQARRLLLLPSALLASASRHTSPSLYRRHLLMDAEGFVWDIVSCLLGRY